MSVQAMSWAWEQKCKSPTIKLVLVSLCNFAGADGTCYPSQATLARMTELTERAVRRNLKSLEDDDLISRKSRRNAHGHRITDLYQIAWHPPVEKSAKSESLPEPVSAGLPEPVSAGLPDTDGQPTGRWRQSLPDTVSGEPSSRTITEPSDSLVQTQFDEWWKVYPRKDAKIPGRKAFQKALKKIDFETLLSKTRVFAKLRENQDKKFTPLPASWLNGCRWDDEELSSRQMNGGIGRGQPTSVVLDVEIARDQWRKRLELWRKHERWPPEWGPAPGEDGCYVPSEILEAA